MTSVALKNEAQANAYDNLPLARLDASLKSVNDEISALENVKKQIEGAITARVEPAVMAARDELQKYEGTVRAVVEDIEVVHTIPKRVEWDTNKLDDLSGEIVALGLDPSDWIEFTLSVPEKKYSAAPANLRGLLDQARTLKHGKAKIELSVE